MALSGPQIISFILTDRNANQTTLTIPLYDDPTGPHIELTSPANYSTYDLIVAVSGKVTNAEGDLLTSDVERISWEVPGTAESGELYLGPGSTYGPDGSGDYTNGSFTFNRVSGNFSDQVSTIGRQGNLTFVFRAEDYGGDSSEVAVQLIDGAIAPEVGNLLYPQVYSSLSTNSLAVSGTVSRFADLPVFAYTVKEGSSTAVAKTITKDYADPSSGYSSTTGAFSFSFGVAAYGLAGTLTVTIEAKDSAGRGSPISFTISDDPLRPGIVSGELAVDNACLDVTFDDVVFSTSGGSGALELGDLNVGFQPNGSGLTLVTCSLATSSGGALQGGEQIIRVQMSWSGTPNGAETIEIRPVSGSVYDDVGNVALTTTTTGAKKLNDKLVPSVQYVDGADGSYKSGATVDIAVHFSEAAYVTGTPALQLGITGREATYQSGDGSSVLTFQYTVQSGDNSGDLDYASTGALAGTIQDAAGNAAVLSLPAVGGADSLAGRATIVVDTTAPAVSSVDGPDGSYKSGATIDLAVQFSEEVYKTGTPTLLLETGSTDRQAAYLSGHGSSALSFRYAVQSGDASSDLDYKATGSLAGTIQDAAGNAAVLTLPTPGSTYSLAGQADIVVDTTRPAVWYVDSVTGDRSYGIGEDIDLAVRFYEVVQVTGSPTLQLETGSTDRYADYQGGDGTAELTFRYTVQAGDTSSDLDYRSTGSLVGTIQDAAGNAAVLTLPTVGGANSLAGRAEVIVDTTAPTLDSVTIDDGGDNQIASGETAGLTITGEAGAGYALVLTNCAVPVGSESGTLAGGSVTLTLTPLGNGAIVAQATLTDTAGNASGPKSDTSTGTGF